MPHSCIRRRGIPFLVLNTFPYILLFVAAWAMSYGNPIFSNADATTVEAMFRDIVQGEGSLREWHMPRSSYYIDIIIYFCMRTLGGSINQGLALTAAVQVCAVALSAHYARVAGADIGLTVRGFAA